MACLHRKSYLEDESEVDKNFPLLLGQSKAFKITLWTFQKGINGLIYERSIDVKVLMRMLSSHEAHCDKTPKH
jgi:hypothetical protein